MTKALTMDEAAQALRKSRRWLQDWLGQHPVDEYGAPYFSPVGRTPIFREQDIARLRKAFELLDRRETFIYFVEASGHIKIGIAGNWKKRLSSIQTSSPHAIKRLLVLKSGVGLETMLHEKFAAHHTRGEWFKDCIEIREFIAKAAASNLFVVGPE